MTSLFFKSIKVYKYAFLIVILHTHKSCIFNTRWKSISQKVQGFHACWHRYSDGFTNFLFYNGPYAEFIYCEMTVTVVANRVFTFFKDVRGSVGHVCFVFLTYWNLWESLRGYIMVTTSFGTNLVKVVGPESTPLALKVPEKFMTDCLCVYKALHASDLSIFFC